MRHLGCRMAAKAIQSVHCRLGHAMSTVDGHGYLQPLLAWGRIPVAWALPQIPGQMALSFQLISELAAGAEGSLSSMV